MPAAAAAATSCIFCNRAAMCSRADSEPAAVEAVRQLAGRSRRACPPANFRVEPVERMTFPDAFADVVVSSAVLHFASDDAALRSDGGEHVARAQARGPVVLPAGVDIGMEDRVRPIGNGRFLLPDGSDAVPRGRGDAPRTDHEAGRDAARSAQDDGRAGPAEHDDVGRSKGMAE